MLKQLLMPSGKIWNAALINLYGMGIYFVLASVLSVLKIREMRNFGYLRSVPDNILAFGYGVFYFEVLSLSYCLLITVVVSILFSIWYERKNIGLQTLKPVVTNTLCTIALLPIALIALGVFTFFFVFMYNIFIGAILITAGYRW